VSWLASRPQGPIDAFQESWQRVPEALLEDEQAALDLVERRGSHVPNLVGLPRGGNFAPERSALVYAFGRCQVGPVTQCQQRGDAVVFLDERPPRDLGWMGCQDEVDAKRGHGFRKLVRLDTLGDEAREGFLARSPLGS